MSSRHVGLGDWSSDCDVFGSVQCRYGVLVSIHFFYSLEYELNFSVPLFYYTIFFQVTIARLVASLRLQTPAQLGVLMLVNAYAIVYLLYCRLQCANLFVDFIFFLVISDFADLTVRQERGLPLRALLV